MSNKSPQRTRLPEEEYPEDLFDQPLETLPLTLGPDDNSNDAVGQEKVGYCSPPKNTRWKKGGPSPNPRGRPKKQRSAKLAQLMEELIQPHGSSETMTKREALDKIVLKHAINDGGPWLKLWEDRKERDGKLRQREADVSNRNASSNRADVIALQVRQEINSRDLLLSFIRKYFPGVVETEQKLDNAGLIVRTEAGLRDTERGQHFLAFKPDHSTE